jgi:hypothetical protein
MEIDEQHARQLWYVSIDGRRSPRFEVAIRGERDAVPAFEHQIAQSWDALEDLIRVLEPHWQGRLLFDEKGRFLVEARPRDPGTTTSDLVKGVRVAMESMLPSAGLIVVNRSFSQLELTLAAWRARWGTAHR